MLADDRVNSFAVLTLGRFNCEPHLLAERAGEESAHAVGLPTHLIHGVDKQMHLGRRMNPNISA